MLLPVFPPRLIALCLYTSNILPSRVKAAPCDTEKTMSILYVEAEFDDFAILHNIFFSL